jgi:hypothetical protein
VHQALSLSVSPALVLSREAGFRIRGILPLIPASAGRIPEGVGFAAAALTRNRFYTLVSRAGD